MPNWSGLKGKITKQWILGGTIFSHKPICPICIVWKQVVFFTHHDYHDFIFSLPLGGIHLQTDHVKMSEDWAAAPLETLLEQFHFGVLQGRVSTVRSELLDPAATTAIPTGDWSVKRAKKQESCHGYRTNSNTKIIRLSNILDPYRCRPIPKQHNSHQKECKVWATYYVVQGNRTLQLLWFPIHRRWSN